MAGADVTSGAPEPGGKPGKMQPPCDAYGHGLTCPGAHTSRPSAWALHHSATMADLSSIVAETRSELGQFFSKPKLSDKLLSKPPFRFLHDIVSALTAACGFAEGVFVGDELNSKAMNASKDTKAAYLKKLIGYVTDMSGEPVQASIKSIMAGKEPELTNAMLQVCAVTPTETPGCTHDPVPALASLPAANG